MVIAFDKSQRRTGLVVGPQGIAHLKDGLSDQVPTHATATIVTTDDSGDRVTFFFCWDCQIARMVFSDGPHVCEVQVTEQMRAEALRRGRREAQYLATLLDRTLAES